MFIGVYELKNQKVTMINFPKSYNITFIIYIYIWYDIDNDYLINYEIQ